MWNYTTIVPPDVRAAAGSPSKAVPLDEGVGTFYATPAGLAVLEVELPGRSVAIVAPQLGKADVFEAAAALAPLR